MHCSVIRTPFLPFFIRLSSSLSPSQALSGAISITLYGYINIWVKSFISRVQNISGKFMLTTLLKCVDDLESTVLESTVCDLTFSRHSKKHLKLLNNTVEECVSKYAWVRGGEAIIVHSKFEY